MTAKTTDALSSAAHAARGGPRRASSARAVARGCTANCIPDANARRRSERAPPPGPARSRHRHDLPLTLPREGAQVLIGIDDNRVADRFEHRQVAGRIAVREVPREVDACTGRFVLDRDALARGVAERS